MQWRIRDVILPNRLVLAPMAGITNEAFRILCKEMGCGLVVAEMVSDKAIGFQNERTLKMTKVNPVEHPISMQIFGGDVDSLVQAAKYSTNIVMLISLTSIWAVQSIRLPKGLMQERHY